MLGAVSGSLGAVFTNGGSAVFNEPKILQSLAAGAIPEDFTPNMYAYQQAFSLANYNYGSAISFALGAVVFVCVYIFLFATRKRGSFLS